MIPTMCMVQSGQVPQALRVQLDNEMDAFSKRAFNEAAAISWVDVPENSGFTGGVPSTSVLVSMRSNKKLVQSDRVELLKELCDLWMARTGKSMNEVVVSISDPIQ